MYRNSQDFPEPPSPGPTSSELRRPQSYPDTRSRSTDDDNREHASNYRHGSDRSRAWGGGHALSPCGDHDDQRVRLTPPTITQPSKSWFIHHARGTNSTSHPAANSILWRETSGHPTRRPEAEIFRSQANSQDSDHVSESQAQVIARSERSQLHPGYRERATSFGLESSSRPMFDRVAFDSPAREVQHSRVAELSGRYARRPHEPGTTSTTFVSSTTSSDRESLNSSASDDEGDNQQSQAPPSVPKISRYLREMDRREILERLAQGEKQAALAKEFNVSRAAVCNLLKHREQVLARSSANPFAKHPKKKKLKIAKPSKKRGDSSTETETTISSRTSSTDPHDGPGSTSAKSNNSRLRLSPGPTGTLHVMNPPALRLLLSALSDRQRSLDEFRRTSERVLWLMLEEALAWVQVTEVQDETQATDGSVARYKVTLPPAAISLELQTMNATPLLDIFQLMEPHQPATTATVFTTHDSLAVDMTDGGLPPSLRGYNVFVLDVVAGSGEAVCATIEKLRRELDVDEASVTVVSLFTSSEVVAMVQCKYPLAKILTARIDSSITRRRIASTPVDLILHRMRLAYTEDHTQHAVQTVGVETPALLQYVHTARR